MKTWTQLCYNRCINNRKDDMNLNLEPNEVQFIVNVLGELPSKTGAFPLLQKIVEQANAQQPSQPEPEAAE
jgi:hypothetical protein